MLFTLFVYVTKNTERCSGGVTEQLSVLFAVTSLHIVLNERHPRAGSLFSVSAGGGCCSFSIRLSPPARCNGMPVGDDYLVRVCKCNQRLRSCIPCNCSSRICRSYKCSISIQFTSYSRCYGIITVCCRCKDCLVIISIQHLSRLESYVQIEVK